MHQSAHKERKEAVKKQPLKRLIYQNWLVDLARNSSQVSLDEYSTDWLTDDSGEKRRALVERVVRSALETLPDEERELVERVHFMGESIPSIAKRSGHRVHKLEAMHRRAIMRLKKALSGFAASKLSIVSGRFPLCPLCNSRWRSEIDRVIDRKRPEDTWRKVIKVIDEHFSIKIRTPQTLIGHQKYHS